MVEAAAKAAQFSKDISSLLERKEQEKSLGQPECKEAFFEMRDRLSRPGGTATGIATLRPKSDPSRFFNHDS
jgi:hypothetical protein